MKFEELKIIPPILKALELENYEEPSPIQEQAIPPALEGRDILGCAQTGTGKTAAFAVPILQLLSEKGPQKQIRSLILTPTRELALQNYESFQSYGKFLPLRSAVVFGGVSQVPQTEALRRGVDVLVATPGRLNDLINQGFVDLKGVEIFVLDEADRMLDMGFIHDVKKVIAKLPAKKQTLFFSATMPPEIMELVDSLLKDPARVEVTPSATTVEAIEQSVYFVDKGNKSKLLIWLLRDPAITSALVFTRTKHGADKVVRELSKAGVDARAIHGNKSQNARQEALSSFKNGSIRVLVATDIAARGIDIEELSHVVNYDLPNIPETYVHRIGRTGRAGLSGVAISFCNIDEKPYWKDIIRLIRRDVQVVEDHPYPMEIFEPSPPKQQGRRPEEPRREKRPEPKRREVREAQPVKQEPQRRQPRQQEQPGKSEQRPRREQFPKQEPKRTAPVPAKAEAPRPGKTKPAEKLVPEIQPARELESLRPVTKFVSSSSVRQRPQDQFLSDKPFASKSYSQKG